MNGVYAAHYTGVAGSDHALFTMVDGCIAAAEVSGGLAALPREAGPQINDERIERLRRREGLNMPGKQPKRGCL